MKKVLTVGVFDYFHLGHLRLLEQARECGDYLIVAVQDDGCVLKYKPDADVLYSLDERIEMMMAVKCAEQVLSVPIIFTICLKSMVIPSE